MTEKLYLKAQDLLEDSFRLGAMVLHSGFRPNRLVAIWRGGVPIGAAVQELLDYCGVPSDHIAIRTASYQGIDDQSTTVKVYGLNYLLKHVEHTDQLLIIDDVFDTGRTIAEVVRQLTEGARANTPSDIRIAVPYYKPARNQTKRVPDYYLHETDQWIKFPHSLEGLSKTEIRQHRPALHAILEQAETASTSADD